MSPTPHERLGFISVTGALAAAAVLLGLAVWILLVGALPFSSGPLNAQAKTRTLGGVNSHAQLATDCGACHTAPWSSQTMADRCLACHKGVDAQIRAQSGLHGRLVGGSSSPTCRGCHTEHHGPKGALTVLDEAKFPHYLTGYSLRGHEHTASGTKFRCADCHPTDLAHFDETTCAACHAVINATFMRRHVAAFGTRCLLCHHGGEGTDFDHNKLSFPLTGKHAGLPCERCHPSGSFRSAQTTPRDCVACHAKVDEHKGTFGRGCGQCHTPDSWKNAKFDHTLFPITHGSEERKATCQTCHPTGLSSYTCYGCHEHTPARVLADHEGQTLAAQADCVRCHPGGQKAGD